MLATLVYTEDVRHAIDIAKSMAKENHNANFSAAHLLRALLHNDIGLGTYLGTLGKDVYYLQDWAEVRIEEYPKAGRMESEPTGDKTIGKIMEVADVVRLKLSEDAITPLSIVAAMCKSNVCFTAEQLKTFPLTEKEIINANIKESNFQESIGIDSGSDVAADNGFDSAIAGGDGKVKVLYKYCIDKTALAAEGKLDPIVGRDKETRMIAEILGRRTKPNVIIVGEPGVGKTALVDGFALNIAAGKVPPHLQNAIIFELDSGSLIAGASYKGEVEDRLKKHHQGNQTI